MSIFLVAVVVKISYIDNSEYSRLVYLGCSKEVDILIWICIILICQDFPMSFTLKYGPSSYLPAEQKNVAQLFQMELLQYF